MDKILATSEKKVNDLLSYVQNNKNMCRTIQYSELQEAVKHILEHFRSIPRKHLNCNVCWMDSAAVFPHAYKYKPMGTQVRFQFVAGKAYITLISREDCNRKEKFYAYGMSEEMKQDLINLIAGDF